MAVTPEQLDVFANLLDRVSDLPEEEALEITDQWLVTYPNAQAIFDQFWADIAQPPTELQRIMDAQGVSQDEAIAILMDPNNGLPKNPTNPR